MSPLQDQVASVAVFGLSVVFVGFVARMARDLTTNALGETGSPAPPPLTNSARLLPQAQKVYRAQACQAIESIQKAIDETRKTDSIKRIERILGGIDPQILEHEAITGVDDLRAAIQDYRAITREGITPEEYLEEKESAFEAIAEAVENLDLDEEALEEIENTPPEPYPVDAQSLRRISMAKLDRLIMQKKRDMQPTPSTSEARKAAYRDILEGFDTLSGASEYVADQPEDNVIFTARGDEIPFLLVKLVIADIERAPWLSPFRPERLETGRQPPLPPASIPGEELRGIAGKYGWWAARLAEAVCPHNDVACVEREARRLNEARRARLE